MTQIRYKWKRFWTSREGLIHLGDGGYFTDPDSEYGRYANTDAKDYSEISDIPCLALLGEPGIGKSCVMEDDVGRTRDDIRQLYKNLREFGSEDRLITQIFESQEYREWLKDESVLELLLDSLDECLLRIETVVPILEARLRFAPVDRLRLRIACRTAEWPPTLENTLTRYWGDARFAAYELCPLRRKDVRHAAEIERIDPDHFLAEVERVRAQPLAIKPVTLRFLLRAYQKERCLPVSERELYLHGCRLLCEESQARIDSRIRTNFSTGQKLAVAKRTAAITVFASKFAIWTSLDEGDVPDEDVLITDLTGNTETADGSQFEVTPASVAETLNTGLFSSRGSKRMGWAHQTYAEFLASSYLRDKGVSAEQMLSLLTDRFFGKLQVIPQLSEVAARIATESTTVFDALLENDPAVLLRSDVATADATRRSRLVVALIGLAQKGEFHFRWIDFYDRLRHLRHDGLTEQLRPVLNNPSANIYARHLVLEIVQTCTVRGLENELISIAFDSSAYIELRVQAIAGIKAIADNKTRSRLIELIGEVSEHKGKRILGAILDVLWPDLISAEQLFAVIHPETEINEYNRYTNFVSREISAQLRPDHMFAALSWVIGQKWSRFHIDRIYRNLMDGILNAAWKWMDEPGVLPLLASAIHCRMQVDHGHFLDKDDNVEGSFGDNIAKRQRLLAELLKHLDSSERDAIRFCYGHPPLVREEDLSWLLERLEASDPNSVKALAALCKMCYRIHIPEHTNIIISRASQCSRISEAFSVYLMPVELDSPEAKNLRAEYDREKELLANTDTAAKLSPPPPVRVQQCLNQIESGNPCAWWFLVNQLTLVPDKAQYGDLSEPDITKFPGWQEADNKTRERIIEGARRYILQCNDCRQEWINERNLFIYPANAGYQALRLLLVRDPDFVDNLCSETWSRWVVALFEYPINLGGEEQDCYHMPLLAKAYRKCPEAVADAMVAIIRREALDGHYLSCLKRISAIFDERLKGILRSLASDKTLPYACRALVVCFLVEHRDPPTIDSVMKIASQPLPPEGDDRNAAVTVIASLGDIVGADQWTHIWKSIQNTPDLGKALVCQWATNRHENILKGLTDSQIAEFYVWVSRSYPHREDPQVQGAHFTDEREQITHWRDHYLLNILKSRSTFTACEALTAVQHALPEQKWLSHVVLEAISLTRSKTWQPLRPMKVLSLIRNHDKRIIGSEVQLLDVINESLQRMQSELHGVTPSVRDIWDYSRVDRSWKPIDECPFSDYVARYLRRDIGERGIVVNREVEIRPTLGAAVGQETDIHVDAVIEGRGGMRDIISVVIEVKGCWHPDIKTAMEKQLVNRYMNESKCTCGLYLVGWFLCDTWDNKDNRKRTTPAISLDEARKMFDSQAVSLTSSGRTVRACVLDTRLRDA